MNPAIPIRLGRKRRGVGRDHGASAASGTSRSSTGCSGRRSSSAGGRSSSRPGWRGCETSTVTAGAVSLEQRMIAWRVGGRCPAPTLRRRSRWCTSTTAWSRAASARSAPRPRSGSATTTSARPSPNGSGATKSSSRQCDGLPLVPAHGGWSALFDAEACGLEPPELSRRLLEQKVAATPMTDAWGGPVATRHLRLVFSNEPVERLASFGERLRAALA